MQKSDLGLQHAVADDGVVGVAGDIEHLESESIGEQSFGQLPPDAGVVSNDLTALEAAARRLLAEPELAHAMGRAGRRAARSRYGLERFLMDWDLLLQEVAA